MIEIRPVSDLDELMLWRREVIGSVFGVHANDSLMEANAEYYRRHVAEGSHYAVIALDDGREAGCGALCLGEELPSPDNPSGRCGYLMNIYVRPEYRCRGVAHAIVRALVEEARSRGCGKIYLESTDGARSLYLTSGFSDLKNMMIYGDTNV